MRAPNEFAALQAFHQAWNGGAPIVAEADKHRFTEAFVSRVLVPKDPRWGRKSRAAGAGPVSKDTVAYWLGPTLPSEPTDGQVDARDLLTSSGADCWNGDADPAYNNIYARWYPVAAATGGAGLEVQESTNATLPVDAALARMEERLRTHLDALFGRLRADLEARLDQLPAATAVVVDHSANLRTAALQEAMTTALASLPQEYELRSLGRVVGTLTPKR